MVEQKKIKNLKAFSTSADRFEGANLMSGKHELILIGNIYKNEKQLGFRTLVGFFFSPFGENYFRY